MIKVHYKDRPDETYNTVSYNCQGGFFMILEEPQDGVMKTTCIPANLVTKIVVLQNI